MLRGLLVFLMIGSTSALAYDFPTTPDPEMTTGDLCDPKNSDFDGYRYKERIAYCQRNVEYHVKQRIYEAYGVPEKCRRQYTIDHFIPLALGGSNAEVNLWPEHKNVKATRQSLEQHLFNQLRDGDITQAQALQIIEDAKRNPAPAKPQPCN